MAKLLKRNVNDKMLAAYRANGRKARGPVTERGRSISRYNAAKHWGRAETMRRLMPTLDEHEKEFESLRKALFDSLAPQDSFEALIIDEQEAAAQSGRQGDTEDRIEDANAERHPVEQEQESCDVYRCPEGRKEHRKISLRSREEGDLP